jgi:hypothetical protein
MTQLCDMGVVVAGDGQERRWSREPGRPGMRVRHRDPPGARHRCPAPRPGQCRPRPSANSDTMSPGSPTRGSVRSTISSPTINSGPEPTVEHAHQSHTENLGHARFYTRPMSDPASPLPVDPRFRLRRSDSAHHRLLLGDRGCHRPPVRGAGSSRGHQFVVVDRGGEGGGRRAPRRQLRPGGRVRSGPSPGTDRPGHRRPRTTRRAGQQCRDHRRSSPTPTFEAATPDIWRRIFDVNVIGTWQVTVAAVPISGPRGTARWSTSPPWPASGPPAARSPMPARRRPSAT